MTTDLSDLDFTIKIDDNQKNPVTNSARSTAAGLDDFFGETAKGNLPAAKGAKNNDSAPLIQDQFANEYQQKAAYLQGQLDLSQAAHPTACIFTCVFKGTALFTYIFLGAFLNTIITFIIVVLMAAFDFWTVKNVTGRLLVGLRWWTKIKEDGTEEWIFESRSQKVEPNLTDSRFFWWSQIGALVMWSLLSIFCIFGLKIFWGTCCGINWALISLNLWAYYKCSKDYENKFNSLVKSAGMMAAERMLKRFF